MPDRPHNHAKDASNTSHSGDKNIENKAGEKSALDPKVAEKSQVDAKGMATIESQRTNKHDGSAGGNDSAESVTIEALDRDGNKRKVSRLDGGTEKDLENLEFNRDRPTPLGGFKEVHRPDGGITLSGVIPGTDTELENITTDTMRALAPENKLVDSALAMRQQIEQHMQPGPDRDRAINQLKSDVTASLFGVANDSGGAEDAGVHRALTPEVTPISVFDKISKLPLDKQAQVIGAGIEAFQAELGKQGSDIWLGTQKGVNKSVMGMVDDVVGLGQTVGKIWQFGQDVMTNNPRALETSTQAGEAIGGAMVTGVKLWGVTEKYLGEVGATGDYGKPLRDLSILGAEINRRWQSLPPGEKAEVASELLTNIAVPGAMAKIGKSARIVERLEDLTDTLKKLKPEDKQAFCQKFGEFLDRLFPGSRQGGLRPAYATAGGPPMEGPHRPRLTNQRLDAKKDENILLSQAEKDGADNISKSNSPTRHPNEPDIEKHGKKSTNEVEQNPIEKLEHRKGIKFQVDEATGRLQRTDMGKVRRSYNWEAQNEQFSPDVIRQLNDDSCVSAAGEMLSEGRLSQNALIDKLGERPNILDLVKHLGPEWTSQAKSFKSLAEVSNKPWAAELLENAGTDLEKSLHVIVIEGLSPTSNLIVRDPWEGTKYEMTQKVFLKLWTGQAAYRPIK